MVPPSHQQGTGEATRSSDPLPSTTLHLCSGQTAKGQEDLLYLGRNERLAENAPCAGISTHFLPAFLGPPLQVGYDTMPFVGNRVMGVQGGDIYVNLHCLGSWGSPGGWLEGSWALKGTTPFGHSVSKI